MLFIYNSKVQKKKSSVAISHSTYILCLTKQDTQGEVCGKK